MKICIYPGNNSAGGYIEVVSANGKRMIIDLGLPANHKINNKINLPEIEKLGVTDPNLLAVLITHLHLDDLGIIGLVSGKIPVIMGGDVRRILKRSAELLPYNCRTSIKAPLLQSEKTFKLGPFKITPFLIDHSGYDVYSILIEADGKRMFYSGNFRLYGPKAKYVRRLMANPPSNIDVLLFEGQEPGRFENNDLFLDEMEIEEKLETLYSCTNGHILMHISSQTIDRFITILRACKRSGKTLVLDLYSSVILEAIGNQNIPQSYWPEIALYIPRLHHAEGLSNKRFNLLKKHLKNRIFIGNLQLISKKSVLLFGPLHLQDLEKGDLLKDAVYFHFDSEDYWEHKTYHYMQKWMQKQNIPIKNINVSALTTFAEFKQFADILAPSRIATVHPRMAEKYQELINNLELHPTGEFWEV